MRASDLTDADYDIMSIGGDDGEFLYGLVRVLKPGLVIESGTGRCVSTVWITDALRQNGCGRLITYEPDELLYAEAINKVDRSLVDVRRGSSLAYLDGVSPRQLSLPPDLVFLDSAPQTRQREINLWMETGVTLIVHDSKRPYGLRGGWQMQTRRGIWVRQGVGCGI